jgi:hypothetical protein
MEALINDLAAHNIQNRTVGIIENGSWAPTSGALIREKLEKCKNIKILENSISVKSGLKIAQLPEIDAMAEAIGADFPKPAAAIPAKDRQGQNAANLVDPAALFKLSYGLFVLTAKDGAKDNGCIINTVTQITDSPKRISIAVNKANFPHDMILKTGVFNVSVLSESVPFSVFQRFGFQSGKTTDKFADNDTTERSENRV